MGDGKPKPMLGWLCKIKYIAYFYDKTIFDTSPQNGEGTVEFSLETSHGLKVSGRECEICAKMSALRFESRKSTPLVELGSLTNLFSLVGTQSLKKTQKDVRSFFLKL